MRATFWGKTKSFPVDSIFVGFGIKRFGYTAALTKQTPPNINCMQIAYI